MTFLKNLRDKVAGTTGASTAGASRFPLGARLRGAVLIEPTLFQVAGDALAFECPTSPQLIEAIGEIDLGEGSLLHRLYLTDDAFLQIATTNGNLDDVKLFVYGETINPANKTAFQAWVEPESLLGGATYQLANRSYRRVWGESPDARWIPPIVFDESVFKASAAAPDYSLTLYSMLYERAIPNSERTEQLVVAAEDSGPDDFCVSVALGTTLTSADFEIT